MPVGEWCTLLRHAGLDVIGVEEFPLRLLTFRGLLADEGLRGATRVLTLLMRWPEARARVRRTRRVHRRHGALLAAIVVIACKPSVRVGAVSTSAASRP